MPQLIKDRDGRRRSLDAAARGRDARRRPRRDSRDRPARAVAGATRGALRPRRGRRLARARRRSRGCLPPTSRRCRSSPSIFRSSPTVAAIRSRGCCATAMDSRASSARSATCCATSSTRCPNAASTRSRFARIATRTTRCPASTISRASTRRRRGRRSRGSGRRDASAWPRRRPTATSRRGSPRPSVRLRDIVARHAPAVFASSFGAEDMVRDRPDRAPRAADPDLHARHRTAARGNACADRPHARAVRAADRHLRAGHARDCRRSSARTASTPSIAASNCARRCCAVRKTEPLQRALVGEGRLDHRPAPRAIGRPATPSRSRSSTRCTGCRNSIRWPTGASTTSGSTCGPIAFRTTRCTTAATRASAARRARVPSSRARTAAPAAGGGKSRSTRSAGCIVDRPMPRQPRR